MTEVQILNPTKTKCSVEFVKDLEKKMGFSTSKENNDSGPLIVVCPLVSRLKPDVNHATITVTRSSKYVVIILHTGSERHLPSVPSAQMLRFREYENIIFIDMLFNDEHAIMQCQFNDDAMDKLNKYVERKQSIPYDVPQRPNQTSLLDIPWRQFPFNSESQNKLEQEIEKLSPKNKPAILLIGPALSGKSSFINSCLILGGNSQKTTAPHESSNSSFQLIYDSDDNRLLKNFRLMEGFGRGFHVDDIIFFLQGRVDRSYQFHHEKPMTTESKYYRGKPKLEDKTHSLVFVIDASEIHSDNSNEYIEQIKSLRENIRRKIPDSLQVMILTKADKLFENVHEDQSNMFRSSEVKKATEVASQMFSINKSFIHPVINYQESTELSTKITIPILLALRMILRFACDKEQQVLNASDSESDEEESN